MWIASPYLIAGIAAVANARVIPIVNGFLEKRQFGSMNSQSSSSSYGFSTSSETTSDGRVSRTTVYGGTPYTITQSSQSSPAMAQGASVSSIQIGQNPPQLIQEPFPGLSIPFQTGQFANRPLQSMGMPMLPSAISIPPLVRLPNQPLENSNQLPKSSNQLPQAAEDTAPVPLNPTKPNSNIVAHPTTTKANNQLPQAAEDTALVPLNPTKPNSNIVAPPTTTKANNQLPQAAEDTAPVPLNPTKPNSNIVAHPTTTKANNQLPQVAEDTAPVPLNPTKPNSNIVAHPATTKANTTNGSPIRNFPVLGLPVAPQPQEFIINKPMTENIGPERNTGSPESINHPTIMLAGSPPMNHFALINPPPTAALVSGAGNAPTNEARLETGFIPIVIESITADGRPYRSDGLLKISNIQPLKS
ncbi:hypothetical protein PtA15_7A626 [Puccinia triticina]|uniref:Uncharacterized protein n=1 Tax=Puccinia triticina TaxID=208348 RepID=A0ABY7CSF1_9BASI|nr:uncharacterized protein PtA15_7A626 [Puccinia triticina]WAQ86897.1 hypothetical protein PtA15_7A626 [Puccinia triticina]